MTYDPDHHELLAKIGYIYLLQDDEEKAQRYFDHALATHPQNLEMYSQIAVCWIAVERDDKAWEVAAHAEKTADAFSFIFYINIASNYLHNNAPERGQLWLDKGVDTAPDDTVYLIIGEIGMMIPGAEEVGKKYLQIALDKKIEVGRVYFMLGVLASKQNEAKVANRYWDKAVAEGRKNKDDELLEQIEAAREMFSNPLGSLFAQMMMGGDVSPSDMLEMMPPDLLVDMFGDDDDEDWEDDDDWF